MENTTNPTQSIAYETGRPADATVIVAQLGRMVTAQAKQLINLGDGLQLELGRGRKVLVKLNALDLYDVELGRFNNRTFDYKVTEQVRNVGAESLAGVVNRLI